MLITQIQTLDRAIQQVLPRGSSVTAIYPHGTSLWTTTFKVETRGDTGRYAAYFLKVSSGETGKCMMYGEFESAKAIYAVSPEFCPRPLAAGQFLDYHDAYFFICEFIPMRTPHPEGGPPSDIQRFCKSVAKLHHDGRSPNGMFGFHVTTCNGWIPQLNNWERSWTTFFRNGFSYLLQLDSKNNSPYAPNVMDMYRDQILDVVIPRLLLPLETNGNYIEPRLVHGDLWFGNTGETIEHADPIIFDPGAFYAHNEYELGNWRPARNKFTPQHLYEYKKYFTPSMPIEDFNDRHVLYSMRFNLHAAILFPDKPEYRQYVAQDMAYLVGTYGMPRDIGDRSCCSDDCQ